MVRAWAGPLPPCVPRVFLIPAASQGCRKWGQEHSGCERGGLGRGRQPQGENRDLCRVLRPPVWEPALSPCPGLPRLFSRGCKVLHKRPGPSLPRGRLERRAESFLKGNAVVVLRRSFHICGWRFPGFSEVNAGSAGCRQIRFTSDLSNRLAAHWLPLLPPANAASWRSALKLGSSTCRIHCSPAQITAR